MPRVEWKVIIGKSMSWSDDLPGSVLRPQHRGVLMEGVQTPEGPVVVGGCSDGSCLLMVANAKLHIRTSS